MELVSIIVPIYNMAGFIEQGIGYLVNQTYKNIEIILIDDGSKDNSLELCTSEAKKDSRIKVISQKNSGSGIARNKGLNAAKGEYVYFFDIDDRLNPDAIEKLVLHMEREECDLVVCSFDMYNDDGVIKEIIKCDGLKRPGDELRKDYYEHCFMYGDKGIQGAPWFKLFKMSVIRKFNVTFPDLKRSQDEVFVARYVNYINGVYFTGEVLCGYYANDRRRFMEKVPRDYYHIAKKSTEYLTDIICGWNSENIAVRNKIQTEYFYKTFLSLCVQFNPKWGYNPIRRYKVIKEILNDYLENAYLGDISFYNKVRELVIKRRFLTVYLRTAYFTFVHRNDKTV